MDLSSREGRRQQGERIKQAAREAGMSLDELARRIGCSRALIFQYASGASLAQTDRLQQIAQIVAKPLSWFFIDDLTLSVADTKNTSGNNSSQDNAHFVELEASLQQERNHLQEERDRLTNERARFEQRLLREDIARLEALLSAYSGPVDHRKVVECCQQLQPLRAREEDPERLASLLFQQGNALLQLQEWGAAKERLDQAAALYRQADKLVAARDCIQSMGHANLMLGRVEEAMEQFAYVAAGEDWTNRWQGTLSVGAAHELLGNYPAAITAFEQALQIVEERESSSQSASSSSDTRKATEVARLYIEANWANLELDFGDYLSAGERSQRCIRSAQRHGIQDQYLEALLTGGVAALQRLELRDALHSLHQALDVASLASDQQHTSLALACISLYDTARHRADTAIVAGKEALALALRCNAVRAEVLAQRALCEAYLCAINPSEALYHAQQGLTTATNMRLHLPQAQFELLKARAHYLANQYVEATSATERALNIANELQVRPVQKDCYQLLARITIAKEQWEQALEQATAARWLADSTSGELPDWRILALIARSLHRLNRLPEANTAYISAVAALDIVRQRLRANGEEDNLLEQGEASDLWQDWLRYVVEKAGEQEARNQANQADWPPLSDWLTAFLAIDKNYENTNHQNKKNDENRKNGENDNG